MKVAALAAALLVGAGCTVEHHDRVASMGIPEGAVMVKEGHDEVSYTADRDGHVYVFDTDNEALVFERAVRGGDRIAVDPNDDRIRINGDTAMERKLSGDHKYRIYFRRD